MATKTEEKIIETSTIRLTADETRAIMRAASAGKPINDYRCGTLADLGLMKRVPLTNPEGKEKQIEEQWKRVDLAVKGRDRYAASNALTRISELQRPVEKEKGFILTPLGKQVARGVSVRLNSQFKEGR